MSLGAILKSGRERAGLAQRELADRLGIDRSSISARENDRTDLPTSELQKFVEATGVSLVLTSTGWAEYQPPDPFTENPERSDVQPAERRGEGIPLIGRAGAGPPVISAEEARQYWSLDRRWLGRIDCALEIQGDSMSPPFNPGDLVGVRLFQGDEAPRIGDYVAVWYPDEGEVQVKIWGGRYQDDVLLISTNSGYLPQHVSPERAIPRGRVFGLLRMTEFRHRFENSEAQEIERLRRFGPPDEEQ